MNGYKSTALKALLISGAALLTNAFVNNVKSPGFGISNNNRPCILYSAAVESDIDVRTGKPTGTSFLSDETVERAKNGSPIEKAKIAKDGTSAFVDVYEYAAKIRSGEMTWEEVEKADLDTVSRTSLFLSMSAYFHGLNRKFIPVY